MPADPIRQRRRRNAGSTQPRPRGRLAEKLKAMNREAILSIVRHVLTTAGGALVANGTINAEQLNTGAGAVIALAGIIWGVLAKREK